MRRRNLRQREWFICEGNYHKNFPHRRRFSLCWCRVLATGCKAMNRSSLQSWKIDAKLLVSAICRPAHFSSYSTLNNSVYGENFGQFLYKPFRAANFRQPYLKKLFTLQHSAESPLIIQSFLHNWELFLNANCYFAESLSIILIVVSTMMMMMLLCLNAFQKHKWNLLFISQVNALSATNLQRHDMKSYFRILFLGPFSLPFIFHRENIFQISLLLNYLPGRLILYPFFNVSCSSI